MKHLYVRISDTVDEFTAKPVATVLAFALVLAWALGGLRFHFTDTWQLVMNTTSSIVTFLMVFVIASAQRRNTMALQLKLDVLIAANDVASNKAIAAETASTEVLDEVREEVAKLAEGTVPPAARTR
jgi:low affinity Fe/Cu permease